jgi:hypothetical protein
MTTTDYNPTPDPSFSPGVKRFSWRPWEQDGVQIGWVAAGNCPHCGHLMAVYRRIVRAARPSSSITATCNCTEPHTGRPASVRQGCGQSATIDLSGWEGPSEPVSPR